MTFAQNAEMRYSYSTPTDIASSARLDRDRAEQTVKATNKRARAAQDIVDGLRKDDVVSGLPFSQPVDFVYFNLWHHDGRTSKYGAFMGGPEFVQWHGNYPMLQKTAQLQSMAAQSRREHGRGK